MLHNGTTLVEFTPKFFTLNDFTLNGGSRGLCPLIEGFQGVAPGQGIENIAPDEG